MFDSYDPVGCAPRGSSVHRILQARILEWVAISFSRGSSTQGSNPGHLHCRQILYQMSYQGSPNEVRSKEQSLGEFLKNALCEGMQQEIVRFQVHFVGKLQSRHTLAFKTSWVILAAAASHCRAARSEGFLWFCDSQPAGSTGRGAGHK